MNNIRSSENIVIAVNDEKPNNAKMKKNNPIRP